MTEPGGVDGDSQADEPKFDDVSEERLRRGYLRPDFRVLAGVMPSVAFLVLNSVTTTEIAIVVSFVVSAAVFMANPGSGVIRALTVISFGVVFASAAAGLALDSGKAFVAQNMVGDFLIAAIFLGSAVIRRPMIGAIAREMVPAIKSVMAIDHIVFVKLTLLNVVINLVSGVARLFLLDALTENQYVIASRALGFPLGVAFFIYAYREITRVAIRIWPADAPPPEQWRPARK
jgi:intracellular septation protein A